LVRALLVVHLDPRIEVALEFRRAGITVRRRVT
jgi:hypothetical protein